MALSLQKQFAQLLKLRETYHPNPEKNIEKLQKAFEIGKAAHTHQKRSTGEPYFSHPIEVAKILIDYYADDDTLIAALLHDSIEDSDQVTAESLEKDFNPRVKDIVEGVTMIPKLVLNTDGPIKSKAQKDLETIRKLLRYGKSEPRALMVKLADRCHNMLTLHGMTKPKKQIQKASETLRIYVPIAQRMGLGKMSQILEREAERYCYPEAFNQASLVYEKTQESRQSIYWRIVNAFNTHSQSNSGNLIRWDYGPNSWTKFRKKLALNGEILLDDTLNLILIGEDEAECYEYVKLVHQNSTITFPEKDYIAQPKSNGYQAYHTALLTPDDHLVRIKIMTGEMLRVNNAGWGYLNFKKNKDVPVTFLESLESVDHDAEDRTHDFWQQAEREILPEKTIIYINQQKVLVPPDCTVLDAVFWLEPALGLKTAEISIKQSAIPFETQIKPEMHLSVENTHNFAARWEWLDFLRTSLARSEVKKSLKEQNQNDKIKYGQDLLQREWDIYHAGEVNEFNHRQWKRIKERLGFSEMNELLSAIALGVVSAYQVYEAQRPETASWNPFKQSFWSRFNQSEDDKTHTQFEITGKYSTHQQPISQLHSIKSQNQVVFRSSRLEEKPETNKFRLVVQTEAPKKVNMHNFLEALGGVPYIESVRVLMSRRQEQQIWGASALLICLWFLLSPLLSWIHTAPWFQNESVQSLVLVAIFIPLMGFNYFFSNLLKHYSSRMRNSRQLIGLSIIINIFAIGIFSNLIFAFQLAPKNWLIPLIFFVISLLIVVYNFISFNTLEQNNEIQKIDDWNQHIKDKIIGYSCRLLAVVLFGVMGIAAKYFIPDKPAFVVTGISLSLAFIVLIPFIFLKISKGSINLSNFKNTSILKVLFCYMIFYIFYFISLKLNSASNVAFYLNLAPVLGLIFGIIFWRHRVSYLSNKNDILKIIIAFFIGTLGATLLLINQTALSSSNGLAIFAALGLLISDVALTITIIDYAKRKEALHGSNYIIVLTSGLALAFLPFTVYGLLEYQFTFSEYSAAFFVGAGGHTLAVWLAYLAYQRTDGFINYLMFNLTPLVALVVEASFFNFKITGNILLGGALIIISTILAEIINSRSEKRLLKSKKPSV